MRRTPTAEDSHDRPLESWAKAIRFATPLIRQGRTPSYIGTATLEQYHAGRFTQAAVQIPLPTRFGFWGRGKRRLKVLQECLEDIYPDANRIVVCEDRHPRMRIFTLVTLKEEEEFVA